mgnify:CR=1 FL=1
MPGLKISRRADPALVDAFKTLVGRLIKSAGLSAKDPALMYLAGGMAVHFYTGWRSTDDVDAVFTKKLLRPDDPVAIFRAAEDNARSIQFDPTYNEKYALMHEDAHQDALPLAIDGLDGIRIFVLNPVDLAVSKLARFGEIDRKDIVNLARAGLVTEAALRKRAEAALAGYVGNPVPVRNSLDMVCRDIRVLKRGVKPRRQGARAKR